MIGSRSQKEKRESDTKKLEKEDMNLYLEVKVSSSRNIIPLAPWTSVPRITDTRLRLLHNMKSTDQIITEDTFRVHQGFDLASFDDLTIPPTDSPRYRVAKQLTFLEFKSRLAEDLGYQIHQLRLWAMVNRHNKTSRVENVVNENDPTLSWVKKKSTSSSLFKSHSTFTLTQISFDLISYANRED